jgi:hypothetical protein
VAAYQAPLAGVPSIDTAIDLIGEQIAHLLLPSS